MEGKLRVCGYCRVSTEKDDQRNSLENQREYFERYIREKDGYIFKGIFYDEGISGTSLKNRNGFKKMLECAKNGELDLILTKEVSRFARNTKDTLEYTRMLSSMGIGVIFISDNIDTRCADSEFRLTIMAGIAQEESRKISERVKWGQERQMEKGIVFGKSLLGYIVKDGKIEVNENERKTVCDIFEKFDEGKSVKQIYEDIGGIISQGGIRKILRNEKYVGDLCQKKSYTQDYLSHKKKYNNGEERFIYIKDHHEGIIDRKLWERVQKRLEEKARNSGKYFYSGKIYCGICKKQYVMKKKNGIEYRRCSLNAEYGRKGCTGEILRESYIDEIINATGRSGFRKMVIYSGYAKVFFEDDICAEVFFEKSGRGKNHKMKIIKIKMEKSDG